MKTASLATALPSSASDCLTVARQAGLRHVSDEAPGISRETIRGKFAYRDAEGRRVTDEAVLQRIRALAIPPAWTDVWICPRANGHIQATGRDARGRKQYRYHVRWRAVRDAAKYDRMVAFGEALPALRAQLDTDLARRGFPREKVLAIIVRLLQDTMIRIGNESYARENRSFGLTTLRRRHVRVAGSAVEFRFRGKSGVAHAIRLSDRRLARIIGRMRELPGQELFQYQDEEGTLHSVDSADVNDYLRQLCGEHFTAKDFRTWYGTVLAAQALQRCGLAENLTQAKKEVTQAIESVAARLGNTPAICRKCYVHPAVINAYLEGQLCALLEAATAAPDQAAPGLTSCEAAVLAFLKQHGAPSSASAVRKTAASATSTPFSKTARKSTKKTTKKRPAPRTA